jgi:hypothetical protein
MQSCALRQLLEGYGILEIPLTAMLVGVSFFITAFCWIYQGELRIYIVSPPFGSLNKPWNFKTSG